MLPTRLANGWSSTCCPTAREAVARQVSRPQKKRGGADKYPPPFSLVRQAWRVVRELHVMSCGGSSVTWRGKSSPGSARVSVARRNLKESAGKALARRTGTAYKAAVPGKEANLFKARYLYGRCGRKCGRRISRSLPPQCDLGAGHGCEQVRLWVEFTAHPVSPQEEMLNNFSLLAIDCSRMCRKSKRKTIVSRRFRDTNQAVNVFG